MDQIISLNINKEGYLLIAIINDNKYEINVFLHFVVNINDDILLHKTANNFIYFVMTDSTIGKYDVRKDEYELLSKVCSAWAKLVAFYASEDESLLIVCTYLTPNSTSEIKLSNYGNNDTANNTLVFRTKGMVLTSNWQILASIHNNSDNSYSLLSSFKSYIAYP